MKTSPLPRLRADQVLVTVGTLCSMSAVGSSETHRALVRGDRHFIGLAAFDAGLVEIDLQRSGLHEPVFVAAEGERRGEVLPLEEIDARWGERLRAELGIRRLPAESLAEHVLTDIAAPLPHDLEEGGLRRLSGLTFAEIRHSPLADMFGLFDDDPRLGPSLQSQLFAYAGLGALAALPAPLPTLLDPHRFRVAAGCAFLGNESFEAMRLGMQPKHETVPDKKSDKLAYRLAGMLSTHGPALVSAMLSPSFNLSKVKRNPSLLNSLHHGGAALRRVPQAPLVTSAACASALVSLCDLAPQLVCRYPGLNNPDLVVWTAADAALKPDGRILEGFGLGAMMSQQKLDALNEGRPPEARRKVAECLAPFDVDAQGTVVGHAGSGVLVTTLEFALKNFLDVTSIIVGWGQSGETGGKGHFAGVGFGGENAIILALRMAEQAHGYGIDDFRHLVAHATGTRTNSRTDLASVHEARQVVAAAQGRSGRLTEMTVGAPKAVGDAHSMGETGLKAVGEGILYLLGELSVGIPTLRQVDDQLGAAAEHFRLSAAPLPGDEDGGVLVSTQGFGGYDGAVTLRAANPDALRRYDTDPEVLAAYLERWAEVRRERVERETRHRRTRAFVRHLAEEHQWPGASS